MEHLRTRGSEPREGPEGERPPVRRRSATERVRRLAPTRLALALGLALGTAVVGVVGGIKAARGVAAWLHARPLYRVPPEGLVLEPSPPEWVKASREDLLDQAGVRTLLGESVSAHEVDLAALHEAFRYRCPWVRGVERIELRYPNRLTVRLTYRRPVARVTLPGEPPTVLVIDEDGVILPGEDLDLEAAGPLIDIFGLRARFETPAQAPPELAGVSPSEWLYQSDRRTAGAAQLAAFVQERQETTRPRFELPGLWVVRQELWTQTPDKVWVRWGSPPGAEGPDEPSASRKWDLLLAWCARYGPEHVADPRLDYLAFSRDRAHLLRGRPRTSGSSTPSPSP